MRRGQGVRDQGEEGEAPESDTPDARRGESHQSIAGGNQTLLVSFAASWAFFWISFLYSAISSFTTPILGRQDTGAVSQSVVDHTTLCPRRRRDSRENP